MNYLSFIIEAMNSVILIGLTILAYHFILQKGDNYCYYLNYYYFLITYLNLIIYKNNLIFELYFYLFKVIY